jgi:hypothetical protein
MAKEDHSEAYGYRDEHASYWGREFAVPAVSMRLQRQLLVSDEDGS